ncbi:MAG TPA: acyl-homoserine-lactone synthase [Steroidobacteraceae bacterium]|jgi:N-acyl-L-homoserine lactone synthetase
MIFIINAENRALFEHDLLQMHRQRRSVFVEGLGWSIPVVDGLEIDCYDREDTTYLVAKEELDGPVLASVRLLPTTGPHLMIDLFAEACLGPTPRGPSVWEVSRYCSTPAVLNRGRRLRLLWEIVCGVMETALLFGLDQVIFAANRALLPLMLNCGWHAVTLGPTLPDRDDRVTAVRAAITPEGLRTVRRRFDITGPVTRFLTPATRIAA